MKLKIIFLLFICSVLSCKNEAKKSSQEDTEVDNTSEKAIKTVSVDKEHIVTAINGLIVKKEPSVNAPGNTELNFGDFVTVVEKLDLKVINSTEGFWLKIKLDEEIGYIFSGDISNNSEVIEYVSFFKKAKIVDDKDLEVTNTASKKLKRYFLPNKILEALNKLSSSNGAPEFIGDFRKIIFNSNLTGFVVPIRTGDSGGEEDYDNIIFIWNNNKKEITKSFTLTFVYAADSIYACESWLYDVNKDGSMDIIQKECDTMIIHSENGIEEVNDIDVTSITKKLASAYCYF